jgi:hypothetical protein
MFSPHQAGCHLPNLCEGLSLSLSVVHEDYVNLQGITHHDFIPFHYANCSLIRNLKIQRVLHKSITQSVTDSCFQQLTQLKIISRFSTRENNYKTIIIRK